MTSLTSLIERIEAATEGSRELDALIEAAMRRCGNFDAASWKNVKYINNISIKGAAHNAPVHNRRSP